MSSLTFHSIAIAPAITALKNAHAYISKGHKHALANNIDPETYLTASLHPDMKDFRFQIYRATDAVKFMPSRINPSLENVTFPDEEMTFEELLARLDKTVKYLEKFSVSDFEGKEGAEVIIKLASIKKQIRMPALEYVTKFAHPNMWFHLVTAYDILRMKGVDVGKFDYLNGSNVFEQEDMQE